METQKEPHIPMIKQLIEGFNNKPIQRGSYFLAKEFLDKIVANLGNRTQEILDQTVMDYKTLAENMRHRVKDRIFYEMMNIVEQVFGLMIDDLQTGDVTIVITKKRLGVNKVWFSYN